MSWLTKTLTSTIGRKLIMSLTGLFLVSFLIVHLMGNLQLLKDDGGMAFNLYAKFMTSNPLIKTVSYLLYATFLVHIFLSFYLIRYNRQARGSQGYAVSKPGASVSWSSRNMGVLGTIVFIFLIIHLRNFWYEMHWGAMPMATYDGQSYKDLFTVVDASFKAPLYVILYVVGMIAMAFHLFHGFQSAFQTLGLNHKKYTPAIKFIGVAFSLVVPALYAIIPIIMYFN